jgi:hypothetical protein
MRRSDFSDNNRHKRCQLREETKGLASQSLAANKKVLSDSNEAYLVQHNITFTAPDNHNGTANSIYRTRSRSIVKEATNGQAIQKWTAMKPKIHNLNRQHPVSTTLVRREHDILNLYKQLATGGGGGTL